MKILFVSDTYYPHANGVYYFVCRIGPLLKARGHEVAVIAPSASFFFTTTKIDNLDVYGVPSVPVLYYPNFRIPVAFRLKTHIRRVLQLFQPDIIHLQDHFLICRTVVEINQTLHIPVMGTNHFMPENLTALFKSKWIKKRLEKHCWSSFSKVYNRLDMVTTPTETAARLIRPKINAHVLALSSGINLEEYAARPRIKNVRKKYGIPDKPILLYVGRIDPEKNIDQIIEAVALIAKKIDFCFVVVGKGMQRERLERLASTLSITSHIVFTGFVSDEDLPLVYQLALCFIIASTAELLSLVTLQAMASGLPVIAVDAGALPELVHENENGLLFENGDINKMAACIYLMLTSDQLRGKMGKQSLANVCRHDINSTVDAFENLYQRATDNQPVVYPGGLRIAWQDRKLTNE